MSKPKKAKNYKTKGIGSGVIAFGVIFALFATLFRPHSIGGYVLTAVVSALGGAIVRVMAQGLDLSTSKKAPDSLESVAQDTGNPEVDTVLQFGRDTIKEIREENAKIPDAGLTQKLNSLEAYCSQIFRCVYDNPAKAGQIRKFMDYYLPTTLKMVKAYRVLGERNLSSSDVQAARKRIDDALGIVLTGCQKQLDNLYKDDVLDITTDIDVLEQMLKRDGLTQTDLDRAAQEAKRAAQIANAERAAYQARQQAAAKAQQQADPAQWQPGNSTNVVKSVEQVAQDAKTHIPQVPVIQQEGSYYAQSGATAQQKQN